MTMSDPSNQPNNPLALGQMLYEAYDATVIATPKGASKARYQRVSFDQHGGAPQEASDLSADADIRDARAATDMHAATQQVFVLTSAGLTRLGSQDGALAQKSWTFDTSSLISIVDYNPESVTDPVLLLAGQNQQGAYLLPFDCTTGTAGSVIPLPTVTGTVVGGLLVRCQLAPRLCIVSLSSSGQLLVNDLGSALLSSGTASGASTTVSVGALVASAAVSYCATSLLATTSDQQLALTYADASGSCQLALLSFDDKGTLTKLASVAPTLSFASPERPTFRLAAGDLLVNGVDQLVIAYSATYGSVMGCAALLLYELTPGAQGAAPSLSLCSTYACANSGQPLASIDLHVAAGMFGAGGQLGVLLLGAGASASQLFEGSASVYSGLVPVDPATKTFPPLTPGTPGVPETLQTLAIIDGNANRFFGFPSDVTGLSVVLGPPTLSQSIGKTQILAIIQAPPYEGAVTQNKPSLTFTQSDNSVVGYNVSSNKMWMFSQDTGVNIGILGQQLGETANKTWGNGFDKIDDNSTSTLVQVTTTITDNDMLVMYGTSYYVWTYPVFRKSKQATPDGTMAVIFPMTASPVQTFMPLNVKTFGYVQQTQNGSILSYLNAKRDGYTGDTDLFSMQNFPVTEDTSGTTVVYDQTKMVSENISKTYMVHNSTNDSAHFSFSQNLFSYIPVSFGLNLGSGSNYSDTDVKTTMLSHTTALSITVSSGAVKDIGYEYQVMPYIYQHATMGCLMVNYDVQLLGQAWAKQFGLPSIMLMAPYASSQDPLLAAFSRSITFADKSDGTVDITVALFNASLKEATNVTCALFSGAPTIANSKLTPPDTTLGTQTVPTMSPTARTTVTLNAKLTAGQQVTVQVYAGGLTFLAKTYWGLYPLSQFPDWSEGTEGWKP